MNVAEVKLWKTRIGVIALDDTSQYCTFKYDPKFLSSGIQVSPLMMPLSNTTYQFNSLSYESFKGLPGLIADSLPDRFGNAIIDAWLASNGRTIESFNIIERLCYIGNRGMGALEFYPLSHKELEKTQIIEIERLVELSNEIMRDKEVATIHDSHDLKEIIKVGTSAGGARAKAVVAYNEETNTFRSGQINAGLGYTYWILKLDGVDQKEETSHTRIEYAYYLAAIDAKIKMSESRLVNKGNHFHFMTKRFDRIILSDGSVDKVHMQTLGALMHRDYNEPGTVSYEEAAQAMRKMGIKQSDIEEFFRRMVFNVMARNQDDHVKNISFLMNRRGEWKLSPAYDVTYSFNPTGKWTSVHQMLINGKRSLISYDDLLASAKAMRIKEKKAIEIINDVSKSLKKWKTFAQAAFINDELSEALEKTFLLF
jgi:serine/threonine-protein kinase HipA